MGGFTRCFQSDPDIDQQPRAGVAVGSGADGQEKDLSTGSGITLARLDPPASGFVLYTSHPMGAKHGTYDAACRRPRLRLRLTGVIVPRGSPDSSSSTA